MFIRDRGNAANVFIDAIQLEEVPADVFTASHYNAPLEPGALLFGRQITDGKIVTHWSTHFPYPHTGGDPYYGPQPNITPTGLLPNPEPDGDFWVDTGNTNIMFRYNQNNTVNFAQTAYWVGAGYVFDPANHESGWYAMEDPRLANTEAWLGATETELGSVKLTAEEALQDAAFALSASDSEILIFFEPSTNTDMIASGFAGTPTGPATGNGDVWIHIDQVYDEDGNQNTGAIFLANLDPTATYNWQPSPDNAIGRSLLDQLTSTGRKNWVPSGYSTWDADIDATGFVSTPNYNIANDDVQNGDSPYPVTPHTIGAGGEVNYGYVTVNNSFGKVSDGSLQITTPTNSPSDGSGTSLANNHATWVRSNLNKSKGTTIKIPKGKR